jgi:hypothetical protein
MAVRPSEALIRTYSPDALPSAQFTLLEATAAMPLSDGQPQKCVGAGVAVMPALPVPFATAALIPAESQPFFAA